jgi:hypothetical protein
MGRKIIKKAEHLKSHIKARITLSTKSKDIIVSQSQKRLLPHAGKEKPAERWCLPAGRQVFLDFFLSSREISIKKGTKNL